jgi:hypothetical protein
MPSRVHQSGAQFLSLRSQAARTDCRKPSHAPMSDECLETRIRQIVLSRSGSSACGELEGERRRLGAGFVNDGRIYYKPRTLLIPFPQAESWGQIDVKVEGRGNELTVTDGKSAEESTVKYRSFSSPSPNRSRSQIAGLSYNFPFS